MMVPDNVNKKNYRASFYPHFKLTEELEQAFDDTLFLKICTKIIKL